MLIRFVVLKKDENSNHEQGLFQAAYDLKEEGLLTDNELKWFKEITGWFNKYLSAPKRLSRSTRPHAHNNAISWYKDSAHKHIAKMRELSTFLEYHGITTKMIKTDRPGYIVYEDDFQVTSVPF